VASEAVSLAESSSGSDTDKIARLRKQLDFLIPLKLTDTERHKIQIHVRKGKPAHPSKLPGNIDLEFLYFDR
jgi:hypothetical protein